MEFLFNGKPVSLAVCPQTYWVAMAHDHPSLEAIYVTAQLQAPFPIDEREFEKNGGMDEMLYIRQSPHVWRGGRITLSHEMHTWPTDPFGYDLLSAYGWTFYNALKDRKICWEKRSMLELWRGSSRPSDSVCVTYEAADLQAMAELFPVVANHVPQWVKAIDRLE